MSLDWSVADVADWKEITEGKEWVATNVLLFVTIPIGINRITEENAEEVFRRVSIWERVAGAMRFEDDEDVFFTPAEIHRRIGLSTNASSKTKAEFRKLCWKQLEERADWRWRNGQSSS